MLRSLLREEEKAEILQSCSEGFSVLIKEKYNCSEGGSRRDSRSEGTILPGQPLVPSAEKSLKKILNKSRYIRF